MSLDMRSKDLEELKTILKKCVPGCEVFAFGSRIKGIARQNSDLDLCIKGKEPLGLQRLSEFRDALSESNIPYKVDVIDWHTISDSFRRIVEADHIAIIKNTASPTQ